MPSPTTGDLFRPTDAGFLQDPYPTYARLRAEAPIAWYEGWGTWIVTRHRDVDALLRDRRLGRVAHHLTPPSDRPPADPARAAFDAIQAGSLLEIEPPDHTRVKQVVHAVFTPRHVRALQRHIGALVERLTEGEVVANAVLVLNAGHEAVVNVTGNGMLALLRHPDQLRAVRDGPALLRRAIEEMMRYDTPLQFFERFVLEDMTYAGQAWPAGTKLCLTFAAANRDPEVFVDPERFDVRRDPNPHLAFGLGPTTASAPRSRGSRSGCRWGRCCGASRGSSCGPRRRGSSRGSCSAT